MTFNPRSHLTLTTAFFTIHTLIMERPAVAAAAVATTQQPSSCIVRVRRKRNAEPENALLVLGDAGAHTDSAVLDETAAGPSKRPHLDEANGDVAALSSSTASTSSITPTAFRLIGTLPMPDVRDAARLFLPHSTPKVCTFTLLII